MAAPKRPNYFQSQFLVVRDFEDEQAYHEEMLRRHNRLMHEWGVVRDGLQVNKPRTGDNLTISSGSAIDSLGREIVLEADASVSSGELQAARVAAGPGKDISITIAFNEINSNDAADKYPPPGGSENVTRKVQSPKIEAREWPPTDLMVVTLARVKEDGTVDNSAHKVAGSLIPRGGGSNDLSISTDGNVRIGNDLSVAGALSVLNGVQLNNKPLELRAGDDHHGIRYHGGGADDKFGDFPIDGPVVYGWSGGALGSPRGTKTIALRWLDNGNVGIGTTKPGFALQVGDVDTVGSLKLCVAGRGSTGNWRQWTMRTGDGADSANIHKLRIRDEQAATDRITIDENGNVGIGTTAPSVKLHVHGGADTALVIGDRALAGSVGVQFLGTGYKHAGLRFDGDNVIIEDASSTFGPSTWYNNQQTNFIVRNGNVGIGTTGPKHALEIGGSVNGIGFQSSDGSPNAGFIRFGDNTGWKLHFGRSQSGGRVLTGLSGIIMTLQDQGKIGIGTTAPLGPLSVGDSSVDGSDGHIVIGKKSGASTRHFRIGFDEGFRFIIGDYGNANVASAWTSPFAIDWSAPSDSLFIRDNGNVGIGTKTPTKAKLEVSGSVDTAVNGYGYTNRQGASTYNALATSAYSIWASHRIGAVEFNAFSDERMKKIQGRSDNATDLQTLLGIEITDYIFKDVITRGTTPHKMVIGQQVEKVFPQAVSQLTDVVPDIYQQASFANGWVALATDLKKGERIHMMSDKAQGVYEVLEVRPDKFRTDFMPEGDKVFVFGREVSDFRTVNYDAIAMLNVSATQQLKKEKDEEVKVLQAEIAELKAANDGLLKRLEILESKMETGPNLAAVKMRSNGNGSH